MSYKYITEDNLLHPQNYMYTQYEGINFLSEYLRSRQKHMTKAGNIEAYVSIAAKKALSSENTIAQLLLVWDELVCGTVTDKKVLDLYIRRFEVRKRLYGQYPPVNYDEEAEYRVYDRYLLLAAIAEKAYTHFRSLKYLNALLKLDDMLISVIADLDALQRQTVGAIFALEAGHVKQLAERKDIEISGC